jgi:hypothetical protein
MRTSLLLAALLTLAACDATTTETAMVTTTAAAADATEADVDSKTLAAIRRGTARYHRVERALDDGYVLASPCVFRTDDDGNEEAAMGYHYVNFGLIEGAMPGDDRPTVIDPGAPEILLYEPMKNGKLRLVGVEFMASAAGSDWTVPMLDGVAFDDHTADDPAVRHGIPFPHYDLHVWTWRNNPDGMFMGHNPNVSCAFAPAPGA